jgi:arginine decarboxylase-like protein
LELIKKAPRERGFFFGVFLIGTYYEITKSLQNNFISSLTALKAVKISSSDPVALAGSGKL